MRVMSSFVLAGWLLGGVAAPCLVRVPCGATPRHACCCDKPAQCCCHLKADGSPAPPSAIATFAAASDLQGFAGVHAAGHSALLTTPAHGGTASSDTGSVHSTSSYLGSCVFRC